MNKKKVQLSLIIIIGMVLSGCKESGKESGKVVNIQLKKFGRLIIVPEKQDISLYSQSSGKKNLLVISSVPSPIDVRVQGGSTDIRLSNVESLNDSIPSGVALQSDGGNAYCFSSFDSNSQLLLGKALCIFNTSLARTNKVDMMIFVEKSSPSNYITRVAKSDDFKDGQLSLLIENTRNLPAVYIAYCDDGTSRGKLKTGSIFPSSDPKSAIITCPAGEGLKSFQIDGDIIPTKDLPKENAYIVITSG